MGQNVFTDGTKTNKTRHDKLFLALNDKSPDVFLIFFSKMSLLIHLEIKHYKSSESQYIYQETLWFNVESGVFHQSKYRRF